VTKSERATSAFYHATCKSLPTSLDGLLFTQQLKPTQLPHHARITTQRLDALFSACRSHCASDKLARPPTPPLFAVCFLPQLKHDGAVWLQVSPRRGPSASWRGSSTREPRSLFGLSIAPYTAPSCACTVCGNKLTRVRWHGGVCGR
jgi:hypothetical protein